LKDDTDKSPEKDPFGRTMDIYGEQKYGDRDKKNKNKDLEDSYIDINSPNFKVSTYALTDEQQGDLRLDLTKVNKLYAEWTKEAEGLSTLLDGKITKKKNQELRAKLESWKLRKNKRKADKKANLRFGKSVQEFLDNQ